MTWWRNINPQITQLMEEADISDNTNKTNIIFKKMINISNMLCSCKFVVGCGTSNNSLCFNNLSEVH